MSEIERYERLGYRDSISRIHRYPSVCKELSFILRGAYTSFPKNLQALIFQDILTAFRLLSGMLTRSAVSAAHLLAQSADAALPKQKKNLAMTEFKHAMVAHKRRSKARNEDQASGSLHLPLDVLVHIFGLLDLHSLVSVSLVNRSWNSGASDDRLWHAQYTTFFGNSNRASKTVERKDKTGSSSPKEIIGETSRCWNEAFILAFRGKKSKNLTLSRGFCGNCRSVVWLDNTRCSNEICRVNSKTGQVWPVSPSQVVDYVSNGTLATVYSSDSDSETDEPALPFSKHWAYPVFQ